MRLTRLVTLDDAPVLAELLRANRDFLAPWEPIGREDYFTVEGQRAVIRDDLEQHEQGSKLPHIILDESGRVIGRITLNGIVRGAFQSCSLGYWVSARFVQFGVAPTYLKIAGEWQDMAMYQVVKMSPPVA